VTGAVLISRNQPHGAVYVSSYIAFVSSDLLYTVSVPTISTTDAVSIPQRCMLFPSNHLHSRVGVSEILYHLADSI
jgi:hypothetical protein